VNLAFKLFRVQQVDTQLDHVHQRQTEIERILGEDEVLKSAKAAVTTATSEEAKALNALKNAEAEVKTQQDKFKQNQEALYGGKVTNPKELQDLQHEADSITKHISSLEDAQLEKIETYEATLAQVASAMQKMEATLAQRGVEVETLTKELESLRGEAKRLKDERATTGAGVPYDAQTAYDKLRSTKNGVAVAKAEGGTCSACGAELSAAKAQAARSQTELTRCDSCKRILYAG
jgi:predicted  nucleic acid-binding Zn-ribbon protein